MAQCQQAMLEKSRVRQLQSKLLAHPGTVTH